MVSPSEGSLMNVYRLHSWKYSWSPHSDDPGDLAALQGRGKVFPILVKGGTLDTRAQLVAPSTTIIFSLLLFLKENLVSGCGSSLASYCCCTCTQVSPYHKLQKELATLPLDQLTPKSPRELWTLSCWVMVTDTNTTPPPHQLVPPPAHVSPKKLRVTFDPGENNDICDD